MPDFNLEEHTFYIRAREFFQRTRQGSWNRSAVVKRLDALQKEVLRERAARHEEQHQEIVNDPS